MSRCYFCSNFGLNIFEMQFKIIEFFVFASAIKLQIIRCSIEDSELLNTAITQCNSTYPVSKGAERSVVKQIEINTDDAKNIQCLYFCIARRLELIDENADPILGHLWTSMQKELGYTRPESIELTFLCLSSLNEENLCKRTFEFTVCLARQMTERSRNQNIWLYSIRRKDPTRNSIFG